MHKCEVKSEPEKPKVLRIRSVHDVSRAIGKQATLNKELGSKILISEDTYRMVKNDVTAREHKNIKIRGISKECSVYEVLEFKGMEVKGKGTINV